MANLPPVFPRRAAAAASKFLMRPVDSFSLIWWAMVTAMSVAWRAPQNPPLELDGGQRDVRDGVIGNGLGCAGGGQEDGRAQDEEGNGEATDHGDSSIVESSPTIAETGRKINSNPRREALTPFRGGLRWIRIPGGADLIAPEPQGGL